MKPDGKIENTGVSIASFVRRNIINLLLGSFVLLMVIRQAPIYWSYYKLKGQTAQTVEVKAIDGTAVILPKEGKHVLVFWATWCPPCKIELGRINSMIASGKIRKDQVLAVSVGETPEVVANFSKEQNYLFEIAVDEGGLSRAFYKVDATPTILLIDERKQVAWATMGLSPTLEYRVSTFLN